MSAPLVRRGDRSRPIAYLALVFCLAACSDPTASAPNIERVHVVAAVAASTPTAVAIGNITGYGVNDAGTIVGPSTGKTSSAYLWDASTGLKALGRSCSRTNVYVSIAPSRVVAVERAT